eukprot:3214649-Prymnesium_polylepis.1
MGEPGRGGGGKRLQNALHASAPSIFTLLTQNRPLSNHYQPSRSPRCAASRHAGGADPSAPCTARRPAAGERAPRHEAPLAAASSLRRWAACSMPRPPASPPAPPRQ